MLLTVGYSILVYAYEDGRCVSLTYLDTQEQPVQLAAGYASVAYRYDAAGVLTAKDYLRLDGTVAFTKAQ